MQIPTASVPSTIVASSPNLQLAVGNPHHIHTFLLPGFCFCHPQSSRHFLLYSVPEMARSLANIFFKGIASRHHAVRPVAASSTFCLGRIVTYSSVSGDSDTHEDFQPTSKIANSSISLSEIVEKDVKENPIMIYMKGVPDAPACGFSSLAVRVLKAYGVPLSARNILEDPEIKNAVKSFSHWPTFPQIFIKGEFVGGSDIILNMHQSGELKEKLKDVTTANDEKEE